MNQFVRCLPCLLSVYAGSPACGDDDATGDSGPDVAAEADRGETAPDFGLDGRADDVAEPEEDAGAEYALDVDDPDRADVDEVGEAGLDVAPGDGGGEALCHPASVGWDTPLVMSPAEFHSLLEAGDRVLLNVFDDVIPQIAGTDAQLPWTDVPAIEEYLGHDLCADLAIYCRRGVRSTGVCATLAEHGYRFVRVLEGGIEAWQAAGYPVE